MIETLRQSLFDLEDFLHKDGFTLPKIGYLQYDNSGENKNKEMMMYMSLLMELKLFDSY